MNRLVCALPYDEKFIWTAGWGALLDAFRNHVEVEFDPAWAGHRYPIDFEDPLLTIVESVNMLPGWPHLRSRKRNVAIAVPIERFLLKRYALNAARNFDHVVAGSSWSAEMLRECPEMPPVSVVLHGAHPYFLEPYVLEKEKRCAFGIGLEKWSKRPVYGDFVIFSGGKLEFRKAQDIVIQAVAVMMQRHADVKLITDWANPWPETEESIRISELWQKYRPAEQFPRDRLGGGSGIGVSSVMRSAGVDLARAWCLPHNPEITFLHHTVHKFEAITLSTVGLFPNRAEACPNSFLLEVMACGKPVVGLYAHGQRDVMDPNDPLTCKKFTPLLVNDGTQDTSEWFEPDLEETITALEFAYQNRETAAALGQKNAERIRKLTPDAIAREYLAVCQ